jgi:hypothetical protein
MEEIFMEIERNNYASRGVGGTALGLAAGALGLNLLNGNGLGGLFGGNCGCSDDHMVSRYDASKDAEIAELRTQKSLLESSIYVDGKLNDFRNYVDNRFASVEHELCDQRVFNNTALNSISCVSGQVAQLMALTKTVVPAENICPVPMPQYNSWTAPTATT